MTTTMKSARLRGEPAGAGGSSAQAANPAPHSFAIPVWTRRDDWLLVYLFLPVPVFLLGYFLPWVGIPAAALALIAFAVVRPFAAASSPGWGVKPLTGTLLLLGFAAAWTSLGGAGHLFYANEIDWGTRYAVLRDLVVNVWPPRYLDQGGHEFILRAPLGYYVVPALLGKIAGIAWADLILLSWTWLGVALFFLANVGGPPRRRVWVLMLFAIASGMDIVGFLWTSDGYLPNPGHHIEWWTWRMKYSSNSTMLYWIPNHVIPGWILGAWLWRFQASADFLRRLPLIGLAVITWSPLPMVGAMPMIAVVVWRFRAELRPRMRELLRALLPVLLPALLVSAYLLMGAGQIKSWAVVPPANAATGNGYDWWLTTFIFILVEVLIFGVFAWQCSRSAVLAAGLLLLCLLPFFGFGPTNDLVTLGAIPALTVMWLTLINELSLPYHQHRLSAGRRVLLLLLLLVGAVTPFQESYRAVATERWAPRQSDPVPVPLNGFPAHYFASAATPSAAMLKPTEALPASAWQTKSSR